MVLVVGVGLVVGLVVVVGFVAVSIWAPTALVGAGVLGAALLASGRRAGTLGREEMTATSPTATPTVSRALNQCLAAPVRTDQVRECLFFLTPSIRLSGRL